MAKDKKKTDAPEDTGPPVPPRLRERFENEIRGKLVSDKNLGNPMQQPRLQKIVINVNVGKQLENNKLPANVKETVELHGGSVEVSSSRSGSRFTIVIPNGMRPHALEIGSRTSLEAIGQGFRRGMTSDAVQLVQQHQASLGEVLRIIVAGEEALETDHEGVVHRLRMSRVSGDPIGMSDAEAGRDRCQEERPHRSGLSIPSLRHHLGGTHASLVELTLPHPASHPGLHRGASSTARCSSRDRGTCVR